MTSSQASVVVRCASSIVCMLAVGISCSTARVHNVSGRQLGSSASLEKRTEQITRAARFQGWTTENLEPGVIVATKRKGQHVASSTVRFTGTSYSITLRDSMNLEQSGDRIHEVYNVWVEGLDDSIRNEAAASVSAGPPASR